MIFITEAGLPILPLASLFLSLRAGSVASQDDKKGKGAKVDSRNG